jgi:hypothetical protein
MVVDIIRQSAVAHAKNSLIWHEYYKDNEPDVLLLTDSEVEKIKDIAAEVSDAGLRDKYVLITQGCCWLVSVKTWMCPLQR